MEFQRIFICIAMLIACAFAVESAAIAENPGLVRQEEAPKLTNVEQPAQEPEEHTRQKKFAVPFLASPYAYSAIPYTSYYPSAYSALPYYPAYRTYSYYTPYVY